jgi:hypothetical protein
VCAEIGGITAIYREKSQKIEKYQEKSWGFYGIRSFFSVKPNRRYGRINLQDTNSACVWNHSGARGSAKAYAGGGLRRAIE